MPAGRARVSAPRLGATIATVTAFTMCIFRGRARRGAVGVAATQ